MPNWFLQIANSDSYDQEAGGSWAGCNSRLQLTLTDSIFLGALKKLYIGSSGIMSVLLNLHLRTHGGFY